MKICLIAPLWEPVPPHGYGGIELYLKFIADGLVKRGVDVTMYGTRDSKTKAKLIPMCPRGLRVDKLVKNPQAFYSLMMGKVFHDADKYDIIHNHADHNALPFSQFVKTPVVTHLHGPFITERTRVYKEYDNTYFISISKNQQRLEPKLNYISNIYHGLPLDKFKYNGRPRNHLIWLGRMSPQKDPRGAIEVARKTGRKLIMAGKVDPVDSEYFEKHVRPFIDNEQIIFIGELGFADKINFLKDAFALLMPLTWQEPFGLVPVEAMACGTPVIATRIGSMPEVIAHNKSGFLVNSISEMSKTVAKIPKIKRIDCRRHVEKNFNVEKMIDEHIKTYEKIMALQK